METLDIRPNKNNLATRLLQKAARFVTRSQIATVPSVAENLGVPVQNIYPIGSPERNDISEQAVAAQAAQERQQERQVLSNGLIGDVIEYRPHAGNNNDRLRVAAPRTDFLEDL